MSRRGFGARIRAAREMRGWSQRELGDRLNVHESTISNLEREQHPPTVPEQVNALCLALSLSPEVLLKDMGIDLTPPTAARLPRRLVLDLLSLPPEDLESVVGLVHRLARVAQPPGAQTQ